MRRLLRLTLLPLVLTPLSLAGQATPDRVEEDVPCEWGDQESDRYCERREYTLPATGRLSVDGGVNGGIDVTAWDRPEVRVVARVQARSRDGDPRALAREIRISTDGTVKATGPQQGRRGEGWSVTFELLVPAATELELRAMNGGISLDRLEGRVAAETTNGGIRLRGGAGDIRAETTNGGLHVELLGERWTGAGAELRTTNGGVEIAVPDPFSARLETGTVNGGMRIDIPILVQGRINRTLRTELGEGGAMIRATTTNGGVVITRG